MALRKKNIKTTLPKTPTGITGLDEITKGGLPTGRPTLFCGGAGAGKTLFAIEFIVRGVIDYGEPGVILTFEEKAEDLQMNVASMGYDLQKLEKDGLLKIDFVHIDRSEIEETGEYDLSGLFIRLDHAINSIGAKRVVLDTIENLFGGLTNEGILRAELRRLFAWLKEKGVTAVITAEKGDGTLTRHGLEEYVSDCVILLDHRVNDQISTRRLRVVKYRGSEHGTNEYPFLIEENGISVLPITSLKLENKVSTQRVSTGIAGMDMMMSGKGFYRGSSVLVSGTAGTGKTSIAANFVDAACKRKERCLYFAFEESPAQIIRNMGSIGLDLQKHVDAGLLHFHASRPTLYGLEMHLVTIHKKIQELKPRIVVLDPITNLITAGLMPEVKSILIRLIDFLQHNQITVMFTALNLNTIVSEQTDEGVSSLVDAWVTIRYIETNAERNRGLYIMKSRGMKHSNKIREFIISDDGLDLVDVYNGPDGTILTGSAREAQQLAEATGAEMRSYTLGRKDKQIDRKRKVLEAKVASLQEEFATIQDELYQSYVEEDLRKEIMEKNRSQLSQKSSNGKRKN
ncbi:circadian clock protein KaiC [Chitinophaga niabensis]|uniref:non-specific serine/threonine protein kinase n=1 Tax=Chitinophaga niabensis TaxID=536979 RepID=A0A1N6DZB0_9BACT|nr:circadian clock protein KaiC [Chitinophaga niabensis]SIN76115.1 circadian clock protein KaiC [Chitinophaga niabensis]